MFNMFYLPINSVDFTVFIREAFFDNVLLKQGGLPHVLPLAVHLEGSF